MNKAQISERLARKGLELHTCVHGTRTIGDPGDCRYMAGNETTGWKPFRNLAEVQRFLRFLP